MPYAPTIQCSSCKVLEHAECVNRNYKQNESYVCARCKAVCSTAFMKVHAEALGGAFVVQKRRCVVHTPIQPPAGATANTQLLVRFMRLDVKSCEWFIHHPYECRLHVNGYEVSQPPHKENNIQRQYRKTDHMPTELSSVLGFAPGMVAGSHCTVEIEHSDWELCIGFVMWAELSSIAQVAQHVRAQHTMSVPECRGLVRKAFGNNGGDGDSDDGLVETAQRISLRCTLTRTRIRVPARGGKCSHLQCFDLENFLATNQWLRLNKCPICNQVVDMNSVKVDAYHQEIIQELKSSANETDEIDFDCDSNWRDPHTKAVNTAMEIEDDEADLPPVVKGTEGAPIELSDSDDEDLQPARAAPMQQLNSTSALQGLIGVAKVAKMEAQHNMVEAHHNMVGAHHNMVGAPHNMVGAPHNMVGAHYNIVGAHQNLVGHNIVGSQDTAEMAEVHDSITDFISDPNFLMNLESVDFGSLEFADEGPECAPMTLNDQNNTIVL